MAPDVPELLIAGKEQDFFDRWFRDLGHAPAAWVGAGRTLPMPVLAVGGEHGAGDRLGPALAPVRPRLSSVVVPGSGHFLGEEAPRELVGHLLAFLDG